MYEGKQRESKRSYIETGGYCFTVQTCLSNEQLSCKGRLNSRGETALVCVCDFVSCETSPQQVSAEEGSFEAETWRKKAITVVARFVLFVEAALCGPQLMRPS